MNHTALAESPLEATSSRSARHEAVCKIPFEALNSDDQSAVQAIIRRACVYRRLPTKVIDCDPELFQLLVKNPHIVANTWEVLGLSKLRMTRLNDTTFQADDGNGTRGTLRVLWADLRPEAKNKILLLGEGTYEGKPFVRPVRARSVMLLQSGAAREANGRTLITARLDTFVQVEQMGVDLLARTFHPLVGKAADHNFVETMRFVGNFSHTAEQNPSGVERLARRLRKVEPSTRHELVRLAYNLSDQQANAAAGRQANFSVDSSSQKTSVSQRRARSTRPIPPPTGRTSPRRLPSR